MPVSPGCRVFGAGITPPLPAGYLEGGRSPPISRRSDPHTRSRLLFCLCATDHPVNPIPGRVSILYSSPNPPPNNFSPADQHDHNGDNIGYSYCGLSVCGGHVPSHRVTRVISRAINPTVIIIFNTRTLMLRSVGVMFLPPCWQNHLRSRRPLLHR